MRKTDEEVIKLVVDKLKETNWPMHTEVKLKELFGADWSTAYVGQRVNAFGMRFKGFVEKGRVPEVEWTKDDTANHNYYKRVR